MKPEAGDWVVSMLRAWGRGSFEERLAGFWTLSDTKRTGGYLNEQVRH
jgi:hypothetical protein